jgi:DNA-binding beta-propeller fold protein YncE
MRYSVLATLALAACSSGLKDHRFPTGSDTMVATARYDAVVAVNVDEGTISRLDLGSDEVTELVVGAEPTRIARAGNRFFVTLRGERAVAVISKSFEVEKLIKTGAEPFGVVASENGKRVYVSVSQSGEVIEIDAKKLERLRTFKVEDEPRWLALHPSNKSLFVASAFGGRLTRIDLNSGGGERVDLPETQRTSDAQSTVDLTARITGDLAVTPDGNRLLVPAVYVDNTTPVEEPVEGRPVKNGYGADGMTLGRINPTVVRIPLERDGRIHAEEDPIVIFIGAFLGKDVVRSYPSSVTASPDSDKAAVTMEASDAIVVVHLHPFKGQGDAASSSGHRGETIFMDVMDTGFSEGAPVPTTMPGEGGMYERPVVAIGTGSRGPLGVTFVAKDQAFVHGFIDREISDLNWASANVAVNDLARDRFFQGKNPRANLAVKIAAKSLPDEVEAGRSLFYSAVEEQMAAPGAGVSCSTCHLDGRTDGLTWMFEKGPRQTPSLAGVVSGTTPVTWSNEVASVADEAMLTAELRMGGVSLGWERALEIQAYVDWSREVEVDAKDSDSEGVQRGRDLFNRSDVGCGTCHSGPLLTDNQSHILFGDVPMNTPSLIGIEATAPYLHDGSAGTLSDVLALSANAQMGDTSTLSRQERDDLMEYLRSL